MAIQDIIKELDATSGGSLVRRVRKLVLAKNRSVLFIGLGGLGSSAVNAIKSIYLKEFEHSENVRFLAVDTDTGDQGGLLYGHGEGAMKGDELFQVFDSDAIELLINPPQEVKNWVGKLEPRPLDSKGAQGIRQVGRVMLCGTGKYEQLRNRIDSLVDEIHSDTTPINVVLIAGISGGTGSGTFIDVSYMIKDILSWRREQRQEEVTQWGVFFTPSVQRSIPAIQGSATLWGALCRNGYAAFKELDYFSSNGSMARGAKPLYSLVAPGGRRVQSAEPIFDEGRVFIVSGNGRTSKCSDIVKATARSLINMFQQVEMTSGEQSIMSAASNFAAYFSGWRTRLVGQPDEGKAADPMGISNSEFPAFMNYNYLSFGHSSVYFPRDEIMAYCANEVLTKVNDVWKGADRLSQKNVARWVNSARLGSNAQVVSAIKDVMGLSAADLRVNEVTDAGSWPNVTMYILGRGKVTETALTMQCAKEKAENTFRRYANDQAVVTFASKLAKGLTDTLSSPKFIVNYGPFAAIAALTGYGDVRGCCSNLQDLIAAVQRDASNAKQAMDEAEANMREQSKILESDPTPTDPEVAVFIDACEGYSSAYLDYLVYTQLLDKVLPKVHQNLLDFNNETFNIYVPVMEALTEMLNKDATFFAETTHVYDGMRETFGMDAYGISESEAKRDKFVKLFAGYVNTDRAGEIAYRFAQSMFGNVDSRERWAKYAEAPEALADEIRGIFEGFFRPFVDDLLEKFVVLAYADADRIGNLTPDRLDVIWNAEEGTPERQIRDTAIDAAARAIASSLEDAGAPLVNLEGGAAMARKMENRMSLVLLRSMTTLNPAILRNMQTKVEPGYIDDDFKSTIYSLSYTFPIALPLVQGFGGYAQHYFDSERDASTSAGRHLDERGQNWVRFLPELFGMDAEEYYESYDRGDLAISHLNGRGADRKLYEEIREAVQAGVSGGYIYFDDGPDQCYKLVCDVTSSDGFATFRQVYGDLLQRGGGSKPTLAESLAKTEELHHSVSFETVKLTCNNGPLASRQAETPADPRDFSNLCRVVRSNMRSTESVLGAAAGFDGGGLFSAQEEVSAQQQRAAADSDAADKYSDRIRLFCDMLLCGLAEYRPGDKAWFYRRKKDSEFEELCKVKMLQAGLEEKLTLFLGFAKGVWRLDDDLCAVLGKACDSLIDDDDYELRPEIIAEARAVLALEALTNELVSERDSELNKMASNSRNADCYSVPRQADGSSSIFDNLDRFHRDVVARLNVSK